MSDEKKLISDDTLDLFQHHRKIHDEDLWNNRFNWFTMDRVLARMYSAERALRAMYKRRAASIFIEKEEHVDHFFKVAEEHFNSIAPSPIRAKLGKVPDFAGENKCPTKKTT